MAKLRQRTPETLAILESSELYFRFNRRFETEHFKNRKKLDSLINA